MNLKPCPFCCSVEADFENHPETCFLHRLERNVTHRHTYCIEEIWKSWNTRPIEDEMLEALIDIRRRAGVYSAISSERIIEEQTVIIEKATGKTWAEIQKEQE